MTLWHCVLYMRHCRNGSHVYTGQYYVMKAVDRRDAGLYECSISNTLTPTLHQSQTHTGRAAFNLRVMCMCQFSLLSHAQGFHASWKILEFISLIFRDVGNPGKWVWFWKVVENENPRYSPIRCVLWGLICIKFDFSLWSASESPMGVYDAPLNL